MKFPEPFTIQFPLQAAANGLFDKIDKELRPKVFFLSTSGELSKIGQSVCLEPSDCGFSADQFSQLNEFVHEQVKADWQKRFFVYPVLHGQHSITIPVRAYMESIKNILSKTSGDINEYNVGEPIYIDGGIIFPILSLDKEAVAKHYSLKKDIKNITVLQRSLIESAVMTFLKEMTFALKDIKSDGGGIENRSDELILKAGRSLSYTISEAGHNYGGLSQLFDACNEIAAMKYEGAVSIGKMIIAPLNHESVKYSLELETPLLLSDFRLVRKFLEISDSKSAIICDSHLIYGLGEIDPNYDPNEENIFVIDFAGHYKWVAIHNGNPIMQVEYRRPSLPTQTVNQEKFFKDLPRIFNAITDDQIKNLWAIITSASEQKHGTMIVISDQASQEAKRLGKQSMPLKPIQLSIEMVEKVTSIDGAVLLDREGHCYSIGVILDGMANEKGDPARGARYNSAIRYYGDQTVVNGLMIIIISEDGMINILPDLRPKIDHTKIIDRIKAFSGLLKNEEYDSKQFYASRTFFEENNFYLTPEECAEINQLKTKIEEKFGLKNERMPPIFPDLKPNPEMNDSYYQ